MLFTMVKGSKVCCISHIEDVDGISSAILIKKLFNCKFVFLSNYSRLIKLLGIIEEKALEGKINKLFICDLGLNKKNQNHFISSLERIICYGCRVYYFDHHELDKDIVERLNEIGVKLNHSVAECTAVLIYKKYRKRLDSLGAFYAAAGAITDYLDHKPYASRIISRFDKQFLMLESTAFSYIISSNQGDDEYLRDLVHTLPNMYPHDIDNAFTVAQNYSMKLIGAVNRIEDSIITIRKIAYVKNDLELSSNSLVNFVLGHKQTPVAMVYKLKEEINSYLISIRGSKTCKSHLGRIVNEISSTLGGSGGGHEKACGAVIPAEKLEDFVREIDQIVEV